MNPTAQVAPGRAASLPTGGAGAPLALAAGLLVAGIALALIHITQGTSSLGAGEIVDWLTGGTANEAVIVESRLPRVAAAVFVGLALGAAGYVLQSLVRNPLASPDTLAVNAGAYLAIGVGSITGITVPFFGGTALAFVGGIIAAVIVVAMGVGAGSSTRMVLVGSALALGLHGITTVIILLNAETTRGLFAWGVGNLGQNGFTAIAQALAPAVVALVVVMLLSRRLDLLGLGEETAALMGVPVRATRGIALTAAVLLSAAAVAVAGPIGFVGLAAPAAIRLLASRLRGLGRHIIAIPVAALAGVVLVLGADVLLRAVLGGFGALNVPTGVVTTILGAVFIVVLARTLPGANRIEPAMSLGRVRGVPRAWIAMTLVGVALMIVLAIGTLIGDRIVLLGDLANWFTGQAGPKVTLSLDTRVPRGLAAALAGAALAASGALVQTVARNPLADPYLLGVSSGAGFGAVLTITVMPSVTVLGLAGAAVAGGFVAAGIVLVVTGVRHLGALRLVLCGLGVSAAFGALTSAFITLTDPWNAAKAMRWLAGSTYGQNIEDSLPIVLALLLVAGFVAMERRGLDLVQLDDATPRLLGVRVDRTQLAALIIATLAAAAAVSAVGVIGFVGLIAPHAARALVGMAHRVMVPMAALLGALFVASGDLLGRSIIPGGEIPAGVATALIGVPYFLLLIAQLRKP